jgi:hypothetical protein
MFLPHRRMGKAVVRDLAAGAPIANRPPLCEDRVIPRKQSRKVK